jgi:nucleoside-diphosphate-sugar epimerase
MVSFHPRDALRMNQINTTGTGNIVNLSLEYGVKKLVHVSSIASLGRSKERTTLNEDSLWVQSPSNTRYAVSKYLSEQEVWRGHAEGLSVAIANPAVILGAGFWHAGTCKLFRQVDQGLRFWSIGRSGFVDVRDVADFLLLLLEQEINGERYVLSAQNYTFKELFSDIALALDRKPPSVKVTPMLAEVAWRVEWLKEKLLGAEPVVTKESARSSLNQFLYENDKSLQVPGFQYRNLADTIRETASAYLHAKQNGLKANRLNP